MTHRLTGMPHQPQHTPFDDAVATAKLGGSYPAESSATKRSIVSACSRLLTRRSRLPRRRAGRAGGSSAMYTSRAGLNLNPLRPTTVFPCQSHNRHNRCERVPQACHLVSSAYPCVADSLLIARLWWPPRAAYCLRTRPGMAEIPKRHGGLSDGQEARIWP